MEEIIFTVPGKPQGKGRPRAARAGAHVRMYTPEKTVCYENRILACYLAACSEQAARHAEGRATTAEQTAETVRAATAGRAAGAGPAPLRFAPPVELWIEAYFEVPKSYPKAKAARCRANDPPPCCKPDMDNITKAVADALNGVAYRDDTAITDQHITKRYGIPARLVVTLRGEREPAQEGL